MRTLGAWIHRRVIGMVILGLLLTVGAYFVGAYFLEEMLYRLIAPAILFLLFLIKVCRRIRINRKNTPPAWGEKRKIYLYNGRRTLELNCKDVYRAVGKLKRSHIEYRWGIYNYGKLTVYYFNKRGRTRKFVIRNVYYPEHAAWNVMRYAESHCYARTLFEKIKSLFTDND